MKDCRIQHLREFQAAGIRRRAVQTRTAAGLFSGKAVEILEVTRLRDEMGDKTVAIDAFEGNNLVLVDEGHRGASSGRRRHMDALSQCAMRKGILLRVLGYLWASGQGQPQSHSSCTLRARSVTTPTAISTRDGFGKDYHILNLDEGTQQNNLELYLVACLLSFFQQQRLYRKHGGHLPTIQYRAPSVDLRRWKSYRDARERRMLQTSWRSCGSWLAMWQTGPPASTALTGF